MSGSLDDPPASTKHDDAPTAHADAPAAHDDAKHDDTPKAQEDAPAAQDAPAGNDTTPGLKAHDDVPGVQYHEADGSGLEHHDAKGETVPAYKLEHPEAGAVETRDIAIAQADADRQVNIDRPGLPADHPDVQRLVPDDYDPTAGKGKEGWEKEYTYVDDKGRTQLHWPDKQAHPEGFASPEDRKPVVLEPGSTIDRFGKADGRFLSPVDTPYPERGLPPSNLQDGYHRYVVEKPIPVWMGEAAPAMGQPGGGIQFLSPHQVVDLVAAGYLREI